MVYYDGSTGRTVLNQVPAPRTDVIWRRTGRSEPGRRSTSIRSTYSTMSGLCFLLTRFACMQ